MFVTKAKYNKLLKEKDYFETIADARLDGINELNRTIRVTRKEIKNAKEYAEQMQLKNCKLVAEKFKTDKVIEQLEEANHQLHQEQAKLEERIKELKFCLEDCKKDNIKLLSTVKLTKAFKEQLEAICEDKSDMKFTRDNLLDIIKLLG